MRCAHGKRMCPTIYVTGGDSNSAQLQTRRQQSRRRAGRRAVVRAPAMGALTAGTAAAGMAAARHAHAPLCDSGVSAPPRTSMETHPAHAAWLRGVSRACQHQQGTNGSPEGREERTDMRRRAGSVGGSRAFERVRALGVPSLLPPLLPPLLAHELGEGPPWPPAAQTPAPEPRVRAQSRRSIRHESRQTAPEESHPSRSAGPPRTRGDQ